MKIINYIKSIGKKITESELTNAILFPLKRAGLIGSSTSGYYFIKTKFDLQKSYEFHYTKMSSLQETINIYKIKAEKMGFSL